MNTSAYAQSTQSSAWYKHADIGLIQMTGSEAGDFLDRISTNDVRQVKKGKCCQTVLTSDKGRIVDVLTLVPHGDSLLALHAAKQRDNIIRHLRTYIIMDDVQLRDASNEFGILEITGPRAAELLHAVFGCQMHPGDNHECQTFSWRDQTCIVVATPALCELSYYLLYPIGLQSFEEELLSSIDAQSNQLSHAEYECLRIEAGRGLSQTELTMDHNPLEANLLHLVNFKKGCYIGQEVIARLDSYNKVKQRLVGFRSDELLTVHSTIIVNDNEVGSITSAVSSPTFGCIALGYIRTEFANDGQMASIREQQKTRQAEVKLLPFHH